LFSQALGTTTLLVTAFAEVVLLLYLLLSSGDLFLKKLLKVIPQRADKRAAIDILHFAESVVARYLVFSIVIAIGQGAAVGVALWALGMPDPLVWGLLTAALELIPYLGAVVMVILLTVSALTVFDSIGHAVLVPLSYLFISAIQNNVITPIVFSGRLRLNSVAVLIGVVFWYFVWGIPGAFLAIPIMAMLKALSDGIPKLKPLGEFLSD
jgi:predicted PurR-regulated permease PerM